MEKVINVIKVTWPILLYIAFEAMFLRSMLHNLDVFDRKAMHYMEWAGRFMFAFSFAVFVNMLTQSKFFVTTAAIIGFSVSSLIYPVLSYIVPEQKQTIMTETMIYRFAHQEWEGPKALDVLGSYKEKNSALYEEQKKKDIEFLSEIFTDKKIRKVYNQLITQRDIYKKRYLKWTGKSPVVYQHSMLKDLDTRVETRFYKEANERFNDTMRSYRPNGMLFNISPLNNQIRVEEGYALFKQDFLEWMYIENKNLGLRNNGFSYEDMHKTSLILPAGLLFSTLGLIMNIAMLIFASIEYCLSRRSAVIAVGAYITTLWTTGVLINSASIMTLICGIIPVIQIIGKTL